MTFRDIRAWLHQRSLLAIAPLVALAGIDDLATFRNMDRAALVRIGVPHDLINRLLGDDQLVLDYMPPVRRDIQPYHTTRHGSLNRAIAAGAPTSREQALQLLEDETYAPSSRDPRVARWKTWCQIANSWDMPPAPLTVKLVKAAGASFKAGGYRSFQNYYTQARQEHRRLTGEDPAADIEQAITDVSRSIRRAQGPTPFKDSFQLELLSADQFPVDQDDGLDSIAYARDVTIIGCWWLLRGLEVASAQVHHLWTQQTALGKRTYLTLPIQKNDITGMCVTRSHPCTCPALSRLCPHHAAQRHMRRLHRHLGRTPPGDYPLFPGPDGQAIPKADVIELFRKVIGLTGTILTRTDPSGTLRQRFHEHVCRVSGAQFLTRLGYNKQTVQLVGRWGSEAVARYIQESNLDRPPMAHSQKELQHQIEDVVKRHIAVLHNTFWVVNTDSNKAHLPATDEDCINSAMWTTQCGWRYATGRYKKIRTKPTNNLCGSCFKFATQADLDELSDLGD